MKKISILDTTLRDGAQAEGISYSVEDKLAIIQALDALGVTYIEAGCPESNPKDVALFLKAQNLSLKNAKLCAFGSTRRKNSNVQEDLSIRSLVDCGASVVVIFGKSDIRQVKRILKCSAEENLAMIFDSISYLRECGISVIFDAEHFYDGYIHDANYAKKTVDYAFQAGADIVTLCDTRGGTFPDVIYKITKELSSEYPEKIGVHFHNDCGFAEANAMIAVEAGATHVQGTLLGFGERCGNTCLSTIIPNLQLKKNYFCIPKDRMISLRDTAHTVAEISNMSVPRYQPYIGRSAFAHKAGMHLDGVQKSKESFEHVAPELVGNHRKFLLSEMSGQSALLPKINRVAPVERNSKAVHAIVKKLKELELLGYQFEAAEASFELLVRKELGLYKPLFTLVGFKTISEQTEGDKTGESAIVHVKVGEQEEMTAAQGDGPVHALDCALRKALEVFYPSLKRVHLIDYKVRVLDHHEATAARVRVLITSSDGERIWSTVGVSTDIIKASLSALMDSIEYKLISDMEEKI